MARNEGETPRALARPAEPWSKRCACGCTFGWDAWNQLLFVGRQADETDEIELRHCTCGSTIAVLVNPGT